MLKFAIAILVACLTSTVGVCQVIGGDFDHLSAKERTRIAKEEESGAPKDERYQAVMSEAEALFQKQEYDEALLRFQEARDIRPYNVYPRVKIQDLQALIAKRDAVKSAADPLIGTVESAPAPSERPLSAAVGPAPELPAKDKPVLHPGPALRDTPQGNEIGTKPPVPTQRPEPVVVRTERVPDLPAEPLEEGELIYMEGRAVVVERRIALEGRIAVFRKVTHPWGAVVYFKDATAIPERMWTEVFGNR